jgi:peptidoglycan/LPS O-acetylase OafA/YrhL
LDSGGTWSAPTVNLFNNFGGAAVALFFMVTGCLFYPIVLAGAKSTSWRSVYIKRVFRIMPLVIFSIALVLAAVSTHSLALQLQPRDLVEVAKWLAQWSDPDLFGYPRTGQVNACVLSSLWYEWVFYLCLLPLCAFAADLISGSAKLGRSARSAAGWSRLAPGKSAHRAVPAALRYWNDRIRSPAQPGT